MKPVKDSTLSLVGGFGSFSLGFKGTGSILSLPLSSFVKSLIKLFFKLFSSFVKSEILDLIRQEY